MPGTSSHCKYCGRCKSCHLKRPCVMCGLCQTCVGQSKKRPYKKPVKKKESNIRNKTVRTRQANVRQRQKSSERRSRRQQRHIRFSDAGTQITSPHALSPLFVSGSQPPPQHSRTEEERRGQITPEMILESLRELTMWKEYVDFNSILKYIKRIFTTSKARVARTIAKKLHYPIRKHRKQAEELYRKLWIAQTAGIVCVDRSNRWRLRSALEKLRHLPESVISLFWRLYCDTMCALDRKLKIPKPDEPEKPKVESDSDSLPSVSGTNHQDDMII